MPYGSMHGTTEDWLRKRCKESGLDFEAAVHPDGQPETDGADTTGYYTVSVIFGGALDEEFCMGPTIYEVNVADWLAEQCEYEALKQQPSPEYPKDEWEILVHRFDDPDCHYRVTSEDWLTH